MTNRSLSYRNRNLLYINVYPEAENGLKTNSPDKIETVLWTQ
jgi:hypothetical protein